MATKKDLVSEVNRLNNKYCKGTKNKLAISQAYGGYQVVLTGKKRKDGKYFKNSLYSGQANITIGHDTANKTLNELYKAESRGWLKSSIKYHNKY